MQGSINFDGTLSGSIAGGGGGGGSEVTITPTLQSGVKVADYSIDGEMGEIYAPEGSEISVTAEIQSGVKLATITIDGVGVDIYATSYRYIDQVSDDNSLTIGGFSAGNSVTPVNIPKVEYTDQAGADSETIGVLSVGDTDYNIKQKITHLINYSTSEQNTGRKWIDGRDIYQITFYAQTISSTNFIAILGDSSDLNVDILVNAYGSATYIENGAKQIIPIPQYFNNSYYVRGYVITEGSSLIGSQYSGKCCLLFELSNDSLQYYSHDLVFNIEYVKVV